jgi:hypothetical protein
MNKTAPGFLNCYELDEWLSSIEEEEEEEEEEDDDDEFIQSRFYGD